MTKMIKFSSDHVENLFRTVCMSVS